MSTKLTDKTWQQGLVRIRAHLDAGMAVLLNYESTAGRPLQGGTVGRADGAWSKAMCEQVGYPTDMPILVSFDTEVRTGGKVRPEAVAYGREFAAACNPYPIGVYGGTPIIRELADLCVLGWRAMAGAWSDSVPTVVHWRQRRPTKAEQADMPYVGTSAGWSLDVNDALLPFPAWTLTTEQPDVIDPKPTPPIVVTPPSGKEPSDMAHIDFGVAGVDSWFTRMHLGGDLVLTHEDGPLDAVLRKLPIDAAQVTEAELLALLQGGKVRTRGASPFVAHGVAPNATLDAAWTAASEFVPVEEETVLPTSVTVEVGSVTLPIKFG